MPGDFMNQAGYRLVTDLPDALRPWRDRPVAWENVSPTTGTYRVNADGVYLYHPDGGTEGYDHPVGQAQFGLGCLASYCTETDQARRALFLTRAQAQADRLIGRRLEARGGWWFPYGFDFAHTVHSGVDYQAPWYSGMAQGEVLSLFVQLAQIDGISTADRDRYLAAADQTFASLQALDDGYPWAVNVDAAGHLWIQEYPGATPGTGDYTYNGMIFAMFGVWDYHAATGSSAAAALYDACATTIAAHVPRLRNVRWHSFYCGTHRVPAPTYHRHHVNLLRQIHWQTGSPDFADAADRLVDDYPSPAVSGTVALEAGAHTLYRFDTAASGAWTADGGDLELERKTVTFSRDTSAPASMRRRIQGRGIYCRISDGPYTGWWVGESWSKAYLRGVHLTTTYRPERTVTFPGGSTPVQTYRVTSDGTVTSVKTVSFTAPSNAPADRRAIVNGRPMFQITAGGLTSYWVPASAVTVDSAPATG
ncbi:D-glucuronyl C5-epimerase family protein [Streptomyces lavendulocolor]|uniref:D-glucuronyl C5-epimerase family protein n=1 Tax=Streptomyces lavendulocolor TaxID=67316 RepID=UPI003C2EA57F